MGLKASDPLQCWKSMYNLWLTLCVWFFHILRFNQLWVMQYLLSKKKKNSSVIGPSWFKPMLFKGQLYSN